VIDYTMDKDAKPVYTVRGIKLENVDIETSLDKDSEEVKTDLLSYLKNREFQIFKIHRYDNETEYKAFYQPTKHVLILMNGDMIVYAKDIPSMYLGLKWWTQEPEIWEHHLVATNKSN
jgi:hypothetical protein